jgi:basic amino acid/polyamine antiporter, APA family
VTTTDLTPEVSAQHGLYVRKATGLVREVSPRSALWFNVLTAVPGLGLGVSVFYVLGTYPGAHIEAAYLMIGVLAIAIALPFALLTMIMPRSGADYILVSRSLHPVLGLISSLTLFVAVLLAQAFFASTFVSVGLVPALDTIGLISHSAGWVHLASDISTKGWTFGLGIAVAAIALGIQSLRLRVAMKVMIGLFAIGMFGMIVAAIAMLFTSRASFTGHFNALAGGGEYAKLVAAATRQGVGAPGTSWAHTVPALGALSGYFAFAWWSTNYSGEIQRARSWRTPAIMTGSVAVMVVIYLVFTVILFHMAGDKFIAAANALNGTSSWKLPVTPFWLPLAGIGVNSSFLTAVLSLTFLLWFPLVLAENAAQPTRALFAWSFDGLLPRRVADVNERTGVPIAAITITFVGIVAATIWAVWSSSFNTVLATTTLMLIVPMIFVGLSATLLPFTKPDLWQASPISGRFLGIPVMSLIGAVGLAASIFIFTIFWVYTKLGLPAQHTLIALIVLVIVGIVGYYGALAIQRRRGIDISLNYAEIPPE